MSEENHRIWGAIARHRS